MVLHTNGADFLKKQTLRVQSLIRERYLKILKTWISRENHSLSIEVFIIWFDTLLSNISGLKNRLLSCKMRGSPFHMTHTVYSDIILCGTVIRHRYKITPLNQEEFAASRSVCRGCDWLGWRWNIYSRGGRRLYYNPPTLCGAFRSCVGSIRHARRPCSDKFTIPWKCGAIPTFIITGSNCR